MPFEPQANMSCPFAKLAPHLDLPQSYPDLACARAREELSFAFHENPEHARLLRQLSRNSPTSKLGLIDSRLVDLALTHGVLSKRSDGYVLADAAAQSYVFGRWLEELSALALYEAGAAEVRLGQKVYWRAGTDGSEHMNEIDAMAIYQERLVLVSCKATATLLLEEDNGDDRLFEALQELSYWNAHFGKGEAIPIFVTTSDFYDEQAKSFRSPKLLERARALGIFIVPADYGNRARLIGRFREILNQAP